MGKYDPIVEGLRVQLDREDERAEWLADLLRRQGVEPVEKPNGEVPAKRAVKRG